MLNTKNGLGLEILKAVFVLTALVLYLYLALNVGFWFREQVLMFDCIENAGIWLKSFQVGCTYPHG